MLVHAKLSVADVQVSVCPAVQPEAKVAAPVIVDRKSNMEIKFGTHCVPEYLKICPAVVGVVEFTAVP